jgi:hypothetical protein
MGVLLVGLGVDTSPGICGPGGGEKTTISSWGTYPVSSSRTACRRTIVDDT